ncbi:hypothetical protein C241_13147 [Bradyrhizobium lupini HPC(L)]|uniref:Uncharacterized protein n=2 Tax=Rhizobium lupini TaxID=136996 RepID=A0ABP2RQP3_RHILU|nr:hypothetical protein C241_13147 [Bradyrhizobium lupini HPC(L)]
MRPAGEITATAKAAVNAAFAHVTLGGGVGLREAAAIDDYASHDVLAARRAEDEKDDWSAITVEDVDLHSASPAFFDAEAMRFHLPAYMSPISTVVTGTSSCPICAAARRNLRC